MVPNLEAEEEVNLAVHLGLAIVEGQGLVVTAAVEVVALVALAVLGARAKNSQVARTCVNQIGIPCP